MTPAKGWGLEPLPGTSYHWSARAIYRDSFIDLLWDRAGMEGEPTGEERGALAEWIDEKGLPALRALIETDFLGGYESREVSIAGDGYRIRANPQGSYGYLYLSAAPDPTATEPTPKPKKKRQPAKKKRKAVSRGLPSGRGGGYGW